MTIVAHPASRRTSPHGVASSHATQRSRTTRSKADAERSTAWYRQPILWLAGIIFLATIAGCALMIVLGARYADEPVAEADLTLLKMPLGRSAPSRELPGPR